jgi:hypothetical protein
MQRGDLGDLLHEAEPNIYNGAAFKWRDLVDAMIYFSWVLALAANTDQARRTMPYGSYAIFLLSLTVMLLERFLPVHKGESIVTEYGRCSQRSNLDQYVETIEKNSMSCPHLFFDLYTRSLIRGEPVMLNTGHVVGIQSAKALVQAKATLFGSPVLHYTRSDVLDLAYRDFIEAQSLKTAK